MPSAEHETPIALVKSNPDVLVWLLTEVFLVDAPKYDRAQVYANDVQVLVPSTHHLDSAVRFCDEADRTVLVIAMEVQRGWDEDKLWTWKLYVADLEVKLRCRGLLILYFPDPALARSYKRRLDADESSLPLRPLIFTPKDVPLLADVDQACINPAVTVLSALCHANEPEVEQMFPALAEVLRSVTGHRAVSYYDAVLAGLPKDLRTRWRDFMSTTAGHRFFSEELRTMVDESKAEGRAEGEARGEALAVLKVLTKRGIDVPEPAREQILGCSDTEQLDEWLGRALTAASVDEVVGDTER